MARKKVPQSARLSAGGGPIAIWAMPKCRGRQGKRVFPNPRNIRCAKLHNVAKCCTITEKCVANACVLPPPWQSSRPLPRGRVELLLVGAFFKLQHWWDHFSNCNIGGSIFSNYNIGGCIFQITILELFSNKLQKEKLILQKNSFSGKIESPQ